LDSLKVGLEHKVVLHIGGVYNDKQQAIKRFITNYHRLDNEIKDRLVLENDDKSYNICDVLEIASIINTPVIYDNLHNEINSCDRQKSHAYWINECRKTWKERDGKQKIHYSQQDTQKKTGSHSNSIRINKFMDFYDGLESKDIDIMLEVKDKNLSAVKCINCTSGDKTVKDLELEWRRYKYSVFEKSPADYKEIRKLLQNKDFYPAVHFYNLLEEALLKEDNIENSINAALRIWKYFEKVALMSERRQFLKMVNECKLGTAPFRTIKSFLLKTAVKYRQSNLLNSYYFIL
jgi:UV DNA damage endonuclease